MQPSHWLALLLSQSAAHAHAPISTQTLGRSPSLQLQVTVDQSLLEQELSAYSKKSASVIVSCGGT